jgi:SulP family sulfate permease
LPIWPWLPAGPGGEPFVLGFDAFRALAAGAFAIAMLGAIESLLSAVVADGMAHTKHDPDAELMALGVGNLVVPFFGGIAATGALARTATNVKSGARSPIAAMIHAITVLVAVLVLAPLLGYLPMAALAALLLVVAWNMADLKHFAHTVRVAPKSDVAVLVTCYVLTVGLDMVIGVSVGMVLAAFLFMRRMAEVTHARLTDGTRADVPHPLPPGVVVYEISGPLFFGAAQRAMATLDTVGRDVRVVVILLDQVHAMDATGLVALESALDSLRQRQCRAILCGVRAQPRELMERARVHERVGVSFAVDAREGLVAAAGG